MASEFQVAKLVLPRIRVRPHTLSFQNGYTVLATSLDGEIDGREDHGLYERDTRYLARYQWKIDGEPLIPVVVQPIDSDKLQGYYRTQLESGYPGQTLQIQINRLIGQGMHEDFIVENYCPTDQTMQLKLFLQADFMDMFEALQGERQQCGEARLHWEQALQTLTWHYRIEGVRHGLVVRVHSEIPATFHGNHLLWETTLGVREKIKICTDVAPVFNGHQEVPVYGCLGCPQSRDLASERQKERWLQEATAIQTANHAVMKAFETAKFDLISMRLWDEDPRPDAWIPVAGLPNYVGIFGRDCLTAGWQAGLYSPQMMRGAVLMMNRYQADHFEDWRDEQPGKMLHEARLGPLSLLNRLPQQRYYGSTTSTPLYLIVLSEYFHWTGDLHFIRENLPHMERALAWIEQFGDLDGDGLYEYQTVSSQGLKNQGWKDSNEGIVGADGRQIEPPTATCEEQAWVYEAKIRCAILYSALRDFKRAEQLLAEAHALKEKFNQAFWMPEEGYYALALDAEKRQVASITSNPGHCLVSGIIPEDRAAQTIARMLQPDLFSGWGLRTLSTQNSAFNPYAYHLGTVWPVENGTFCMAFVRYGHHQEAHTLAKAVFDASNFFEYGRLPEAISGHPRDAEHPMPSVYPNSCMPQAWSSSAIPIMIQAILGLYPFAPLKLLLLEPHLPDWLPELKLYNLQVGQARISLEFWRGVDGRTHHRALNQSGTLHILPKLINIHRFHQLKDLAETMFGQPRHTARGESE
jgi:glycogen debranching enzyme